MANKKLYTIVLNIGLWVGLYILWIFIFQNRTITVTRTMGIEFCYLVFIAANYYFIAYVDIPLFLTKQKYLLFSLIAFGSTIVASVMRAAVAYYINSTFYNTHPGFENLCYSSMLNISIWTVGLLGIKLIIDRQKEQHNREAIEKEKIINELNFLKAQHNPHFLFNSLNALYFQIDKTNADARGTLLKLAEMLRYQLYECNADTIPIDKEISYLNNYIELQRIRLNANYNITSEINSSVSGFNIAPLLILPLVENAFKYVSHYTDKANRVNIKLSLRNNTFVCYVANTTEKNGTKVDTTEGGIGLKNLERRLELLYPDNHKFEINNTGDLYETTIRLEIK